MSENKEREQYIPIRKAELIELLCRDARMPAESAGEFRKLCEMLGAIFHFEFHSKLEDLKKQYAPFDPDMEAKPLQPPPESERQGMIGRAFDDFVALVEKANFKRLSLDDVRKAIESGASDWGLNMHVDFDVFERIEVFARGEGKSTRTKRHAIFFWRKIEKEVDTFGRLVLMMKLRKHERVGENVDTEDIFLKMFKDIPKLDMEMVLPGARIQMPKFQRGKLGASLIGTIGYLLWQIGTQLWVALKTILTGTGAALAAGGQMLLGPFVAVAGYGYKQYYTFQVTKQTYSKMLTESLYYQTLDNNAGVLTRILDEAEEQENREAVLAYFALWLLAPPEGWTSAEIDDAVEKYLEEFAKLKVDFEIGDALGKVERLGLVTHEGERYRFVPLAAALEKLDYRWDNYFQYANAPKAPA